MDGLYTRPFIAYLDENGKARKPFLLPQAHTDFYDQLLYSFNIPEFVSGKVELDPNQVDKLLDSGIKKVTFRQQ
jgi:hypothetical protein